VRVRVLGFERERFRERLFGRVFDEREKDAGKGK